MSGIRKLDHPFNRPAGEPRPADPARARHARAGRFDERLKEEDALARADRLRRQPPPGPAVSGDEQWTRARAIEELKTLVKALEAGLTDPKELTDLIFYARRPELIDVPLTKERQAFLDEWNQISALLVHPLLEEVGEVIGADLASGGASGFGPEELERAVSAYASRTRVAGGATDRFDDLIVSAVEWCPGLSPAVLKSLLAQESNFNPTVINQYGYAGIAQFGREAAREVGLRVGVAGVAGDERLDPSKAIPAAARLLDLKAQRLVESAFERYGRPTGGEYWKFVLAAYNGGEGTVTLAMGHAYREGLARARAEGLSGADVVGFARRYASKWENLRQGGLDSPLAQAAARFFPSLAAAKYHEIGNYPVQIMARVSGHGG